MELPVKYLGRRLDVVTFTALASFLLCPAWRVLWSLMRVCNIALMAKPKLRRPGFGAYLASQDLTIISYCAIAAIPPAYASDGVTCDRVAILVSWSVAIGIVSKGFWVIAAAEQGLKTDVVQIMICPVLCDL